ncbi:MAG TPA: PAS domain-containing protein, partial [Dehalococcoidia bacterium]
MTIATTALICATTGVRSYALPVAGIALIAWYAGALAACAAIMVLAVPAIFIAEPAGQLAIRTASLERLLFAMVAAGCVTYLVDRLRLNHVRIASLATVQQQLLAQVTAKERRLVTLTDSLPSLISYVDGDRRYAFNNQRYELWYGRPRGEITGRYLWELMGQEGYEKLRPYFDDALAGKRVAFEMPVPNRQGGITFAQASFVPDVDEHGDVVGFFALMTDQTEARRREQLLAESEARAQAVLEA